MDYESLKEKLNLSDKDIEKIEMAKEKIKFNPILLILLGVSVVLFLLTLIDISGLTVVSGIVIGIFMILTGYNYAAKRGEYNDIVKEIVITNLFKSEFEHVNYNPEQGFDKKYIDSLELIAKGNTYESNDLLMASYKGVGFSQADVHIQQVTSNGKTTTTTTYFKGRWIVVDFIKNFEGNHQVRSNGSFFKNKKPGQFFGRKLDLLKFESVEFNNMFTSYTSDQKEAYYLITPHMMEKMTQFRDYVNCEVNYGFIDNKLHLAIYNNTNAFEVGGRDVDEQFIQNVLYEMDLIKRVIDELDLDVDLYK